MCINYAKLSHANYLIADTDKETAIRKFFFSKNRIEFNKSTSREKKSRHFKNTTLEFVAGFRRISINLVSDRVFNII